MDAPGATSPSINTLGTAGGDTYKGVIGATTTLQDVDNIDGAGGTDTLEILVTTATTSANNAGAETNATTATPLFLKNVEKVSVRDTTAAITDASANVDTSLVTVNLASATGVTEVINDTSLETVTFQNIGSAAVTTQNIKTAGVGTTFTRGASPVTADLTINLNTLGSAAAAGNVAVVQAGAIASNDGNNDAVIYVCILEEKLDDFNRRIYQLQLEGAKTSAELPGVLDEVITLAILKADDGTPYRAFVTGADNTWGFPSKDRSGRLDPIEEPHLGKLIAKCLGRDAAVRPATPAVQTSSAFPTANESQE